MVLKWYRHTLFLAVVVIGGLVSCTTDNLQEQKHTEFKENKDSIEFVKKNKIKINQLDVVFKNRVHTDGFNGCVLIAQHGKVLYRNVAGFSNIKNKDSLKLNSAFQLASTSKTLTAGAILLLKEQNKLSVNDLVVKHLPNFPYKDITIQMLLSHRSGLSNYLYFCEPLCDEKNCYNNKAMDNEDVLSIIQTTQPALYAKPNKKFEYSNTNYALLASIVEKVSGMTFSNFMEQYMFQPLGMLDTWVIGSKKDSLCKLKTKGHNANGTLEQDNYADYVVGDKGIYSTIDDMYKWSDALYSGKILKKETLDEAFQGYSNEHPGKRNYGYGWRLIDEGDANKVVYHNGWWHGYSSLFYRRLSDSTTVILLSNKFNSKTYHIEDILAVLNNTPPAITEVKKTKQPKSQKRKTRTIAQISTKINTKRK